MLSHKEGIRTVEGGSRSALDLKLDNPKADVECVLDLNEDDVARQKCVSHTLYRALAVFHTVRICFDALACDP